MKVLALDVGVKTGAALYQEDENTTSYQTFTFDSMDEVWDFVWFNNWDYVIHESFQAVMISGYGLHTVQLIGGIKALCSRKGIKSISQVPQARLSRINDALEILKAKRQPYTKHELDALAHLLVAKAIIDRKKAQEQPPAQVATDS